MAITQFWKGDETDHEYWRRYLERRPKYDQAFYNIIFDFHRANNLHIVSGTDMKDSVAHDIATGPGQVAAQLAKHFSAVVASDANAAHLRSAQYFASVLPTRLSNVSYVHTAGQDLPEYFPQGSASLVTIAEALPLMPAETTIDSAAYLLRPGGTLAIWFYGRPHFAPDSGDSQYDDTKCNRLYGEIATSAFRRRFRSATLEQIAQIRKTMANIDSWLNYVKLPKTCWTKVERYEWNKQLPSMAFIDHTDVKLGWRRDFSRAIRNDENIRTMQDDDIWSEKWTARQFEEFLSINLPPLDRAVDDSDTIEASRWDELAEAMGGRQVERKVVWPVVLILATRT